MSQISSDHTRLDERSLALHRLVVEKISANPAVIDLARENIRRWFAAGGNQSLALVEWDRILSGPVEDIMALLIDRSERAIRLRQSSPFAGVLTESERRAVYESYRARAHHPGRQRDLG